MFPLTLAGVISSLVRYEGLKASSVRSQSGRLSWGQIPRLNKRMVLELKVANNFRQHLSLARNCMVTSNSVNLLQHRL